MDYTKYIERYLESEINTLRALDRGAINEAINLLEATRVAGGDIYVFGNGGSAATASHMENDFNKGVSEKITRKYRFHCLSANMATVTAIANDNGYDRIFIQQLENKLNPSDVIVAISGSGNSDNVVKAVEYARTQGCKVIALTGFSGGRLMPLADINLHVPIDDMQITEDVHVMVNHLMMSVLCDTLNGEDK